MKPPIFTDILFVMEAPNADDTYNSKKRHITINPDTDPSGEFFFDLFTNELKMPIDNLFITNSVLCLPGRKNNKYPVSSRQRNECASALKELINKFNPKIVCTVGGKALLSTNVIDFHGINKLSSVKDKPIKWYNRYLFPLYHTGLLGRKKPYGKDETGQRKDWQQLRKLWEIIR